MSVNNQGIAYTNRITGKPTQTKFQRMTPPHVTQDSTFLFWINTNNSACVIVYQYNNALESNVKLVATHVIFRTKI